MMWHHYIAMCRQFMLQPATVPTALVQAASKQDLGTAALTVGSRVLAKRSPHSLYLPAEVTAIHADSGDVTVAFLKGTAHATLQLQDVAVSAFADTADAASLSDRSEISGDVSIMSDASTSGDDDQDDDDDDGEGSDHASDDDDEEEEEEAQPYARVMMSGVMEHARWESNQLTLLLWLTMFDLIVPNLLQSCGL